MILLFLIQCLPKASACIQHAPEKWWNTSAPLCSGHMVPRSAQLSPSTLCTHQVIAVDFLLCFTHLSFFYRRPFCIRSGGLYRERYRISIYLLWLCIMDKQWMSCGFLSRIFPAAAHKLSAVKLLVCVLSISKASCTALHLFQQCFLLLADCKLCGSCLVYWLYLFIDIFIVNRVLILNALILRMVSDTQ